MTAALAIVRVTSRSVLGIKRAVLLVAAEALLGLVFLLVAATQTDARALEGATFLAMFFYFALIVPIVAAILGAGSLGNERRDGTLSFVVLRPLPRSVIGGTKFAAGAITAIAVNAAGAVSLGGAYGLSTGSWDVLGGLLVGGAISTVAYAAIFVPLGHIATWAVSLGAVFVIVFENGVVRLLEGLAPLSPGRIGVSAYAALVSNEAAAEIEGSALGNLTPGAFGAAGKVMIIAAVSIAFVTWMLRTRELA